MIDAYVYAIRGLRHDPAAVLDTMVIAADLVVGSDPARRTIRQVNAEKVHAHPLGALVEVRSSGARLFVAQHTRDCDQGLLYTLSPEPAPIEFDAESFAWNLWRGKHCHGYGEEGLTLINSTPIVTED